jgi:transcriptional regulator with XRE-family HTH domain
LKNGRKAKGLLLREVAAAINTDTAMVSKFEKGERKPTRQQISALAKVLGLNEKKLLVAYLTDKIVADLQDDDLAKEVLKAVKARLNILDIKK